MQRFLKKHWEFVSVIIVIFGGLAFMKTVATAKDVSTGDQAVETRVNKRIDELKEDTNGHLETIERDVKTILRTMPRR